MTRKCGHGEKSDGEEREHDGAQDERIPFFNNKVSRRPRKLLPHRPTSGVHYNSDVLASENQYTEEKERKGVSHSTEHNRNDVHQHHYDDKHYWSKLNVKGGEIIHLCYRDAAIICRRKNTTSRDKGAKRLKLYNPNCLPLSQIVLVD
jgi:hypothetical protein